jgi:hypothetical protein
LCDGGESNPNYRDRCGSGFRPTNNEPYYRTINQNATAMSKDDVYQHNPWRAPGNAPVYDACGMAGGAPTWESTGLSFVDTVHAKQGDRGSLVLPYSPTGVVWRAGAEVEAKWSLRADHGGGYQYRCAAESSSPLCLCTQLRSLAVGAWCLRGVVPVGSGFWLPVVS